MVTVQESTSIGAAARRAAIQALGRRLRRFRTDAGITQEEVASRLDVSDTAVRNWEAGRDEPSVQNKNQLAGLFGVAPDLLVGQTTEDLLDPDLALFFRGEWGEFTEDEKDFVRGLIREARDFVRSRRQEVDQ